METLPRLSNEYIDYHAIGMIKHLQRAGYIAYLVGGCVRDLLAGHLPKDFDIGTSALPEEVKKILNYSFIIGKRFRLVLVKREDKQYEVATFRREPLEDEFPEGVPFGDNIFGTPEQDANRRDFTCNALFYDPVGQKVIDYVNGQEDVENQIIRMIGDPTIRLREDPIRILRAIRFSHKLRFRIDSGLREQMYHFAEHIIESVLPRRREEYLKLLRLHDPAAAFQEGHDLNLWKTILPDIDEIYRDDERIETFDSCLRRLDSRLMDPSDTPLLAGTVVLGWFRAQSKKDPTALITASELHSNTHLHRLSKDQLGLHNWEISRIMRAISMHKILSEPDEFQRRGHRRKNAVLLNEAFPLAVDLAHIDAVFSPDILEYWDAQLEMTREAFLSAQSHPRSQNRRPNRRPGRSHRPHPKKIN